MWFFLSEKSYCHYNIKSRENDNFWLGIMAWKVREGAVLQRKLSDNLGLEETLSCGAHLDASQAAPLYPVGLAQTWMCDRQNLLKELEKHKGTLLWLSSLNKFFFLSSQVVGIFPPQCVLSICIALWIFWCSSMPQSIQTHTLTHLNESLVFPYLWKLHRPCLQAASPSCYSRIWGQQDTSLTSA